MTFVSRPIVQANAYVCCDFTELEGDKRPLRAWALQVKNLVPHKTFQSILDHSTVNFPNAGSSHHDLHLLALALFYGATLKNCQLFSESFIQISEGLLGSPLLFFFLILNNPSTRLVFLPFCN